MLSSSPSYRTRFAPSPTGYLHLGNAYSALCCWHWAKQHQAELCLRIEDLDTGRCRPHFATACMEDLRYLGLSWQNPVYYQSQRYAAYQQALQRLRDLGVLYPCFCTRKQIQQQLALSAPHASLAHYPQTCLGKKIQPKDLQKPHAWRLHVQAAAALCSEQLGWNDIQAGTSLLDMRQLDDVVIARKDMGFSYHLAVVVDDAAQQISHVIRGSDLRSSTAIHVLLQHLLGLPKLVYWHHDLLHDETGERMAKRKGSVFLRHFRNKGVPAGDLRAALFSCQGQWRENLLPV